MGTDSLLILKAPRVWPLLLEVQLTAHTAIRSPLADFKFLCAPSLRTIIKLSTKPW